VNINYNSTISSKIIVQQKILIFYVENLSMIEYDIQNKEIEDLIVSSQQNLKLLKSDYFCLFNNYKIFEHFKFINEYDDEQVELHIKRFAELNLIEGKLIEYQQFDQKNEFVGLLKKYFTLCVKYQIFIKLFDYLFFNFQIVNNTSLKILVSLIFICRRTNQNP